jgi:hypothetical protein
VTKFVAMTITEAGNTKLLSITVPLTSCLTHLDLSVLQLKTKIVICHTADSEPVKQEVNGTVILPPLVFLDKSVTPKVGVKHELLFNKLRGEGLLSGLLNVSLT